MKNVKLLANKEHVKGGISMKPYSKIIALTRISIFLLSLQILIRERQQNRMGLFRSHLQPPVHLLNTKGVFRYSRGDASMSVEDWDTGEPIEIALDPSQSAQEQTEALYKKARKLRRTTDNVEPLLHQAALDLEHLQVNSSRLPTPANAIFQKFEGLEFRAESSHSIAQIYRKVLLQGGSKRFWPRPCLKFTANVKSRPT